MGAARSMPLDAYTLRPARRPLSDSPGVTVRLFWGVGGGGGESEATALPQSFGEVFMSRKKRFGLDTEK